MATWVANAGRIGFPLIFISIRIHTAMNSALAAIYLPASTSAALIVVLMMFSFTISSALIAEEKSEEQKAKEVVVAFLANEFKGGDLEKRFDLIKLSPGREAKIRKIRGVVSPLSIEYLSDPMILVNNYNIIKIEVNGNNAVATVSYLRLCRRSKAGLEGRFVYDYKENDIVTLYLKKLSGKWWVYDPPLPRLSFDLFFNWYEELVTKGYDENWFAHASEAQFGTLRSEKARLEELRAVKNNLKIIGK